LPVLIRYATIARPDAGRGERRELEVIGAVIQLFMLMVGLMITLVVWMLRLMAMLVVAIVGAISSTSERRR
jgi:hypothetical protein